MHRVWGRRDEGYLMLSWLETIEAEVNEDRCSFLIVVLERLMLS